MPIAITLNEGKVLGMVILVAYQIVEYYQSVDLPQLVYAMCQHGANLKYMSVINAW